MKKTHLISLFAAIGLLVGTAGMATAAPQKNRGKKTVVVKKKVVRKKSTKQPVRKVVKRTTRPAVRRAARPVIVQPVVRITAPRYSAPVASTARWAAYDYNRNGILDIHERNAFANARFAALDLNGDGYLVAYEFSNRPRILSRFNGIDLNNDSYVTRAEFAYSLRIN